MEKAWDKNKKKAVSAIDPTLNQHKNRYICLKCEQKVFLAAAYSKKRKPYFKHAAGNNGQACEDYFKTNPFPDAPESELSFPDPSFYYRSSDKQLYLSLKLNAEIIEKYGKLGVKYEVESSAGKRISSKLINRQFFRPDNPNRIYITTVANAYLCGISSRNKLRYVVFREGKTAIFRILGDDKKDFLARQITGDTLYTNTAYFILSIDTGFINRIRSCQETTRVLQNPETIKIGERELTGIICEFLNKDLKLGRELKKYGYKLERTGTFDIIWPPIAEIVENEYVAAKGDIFISANFPLTEEADQDQKVRTISRDLYKLELTSDWYLQCRNIEVTVTCEDTDQQEPEEIPVEGSTAEEFVVPDDSDGSDYYLYSSEGVRKLFKGEKIFLRPGDVIKEYRQTYVRYVCRASKKSIQKKKLLNDVLRNYKVKIPYDSSEFDNVKRTGTIEKYLDDCRKTGLINLAVSRMIREGKL